MLSKESTMNTKLPLSAMILMTSLGLAGVANAADVVQANCAVDSKQASLLLDANGTGSVEVVSGGTRYNCTLQLASIEGPPFTETAAGMLVLEFDEAVCTPAAAKRQLQRDVFLHIADPLLPTREGMAVIERRSGVFQCGIQQLDMVSLTKLYEQLATKQAATGN
jgi:hypothetical protein